MLRIAVVAATFLLIFQSVVAQQLPVTANTNQSAQVTSPKAITHFPKVLHSEPADPPEEAERSHISGGCVLSLAVDTEGRPKNIHLIRCSNRIFGSTSLLALSKYKFKPATTEDGQPVETTITYDINYRLGGAGDEDLGFDYGTFVLYSFASPPETTTTTPDADGVYPYTKIITAPRIEKYIDKGYGSGAFPRGGSSPCDIVLTIDESGKPSNADAIYCDEPKLKAPAVKSLLNSRYVPGKLNGKPVPVRARIHLAYGESAGKP